MLRLCKKIYLIVGRTVKELGSKILEEIRNIGKKTGYNELIGALRWIKFQKN